MYSYIKAACTSTPLDALDTAVDDGHTPSSSVANLVTRPQPNRPVLGHDDLHIRWWVSRRRRRRPVRAATFIWRITGVGLSQLKVNRGLMGLRDIVSR